MNYIEPTLYKTIIDNTINICVDVFLNYNNKFVLVKRLEEPMKGVYWPIGGRIHKGEKALDAAKRKIQEEFCSLDNIEEESLVAAGYYEDQYTSNSFSNETHYHTLSIVFFGKIISLDNIKLDSTSEDWGLFSDLPERFTIKPFEVY